MCTYGVVFFLACPSNLNRQAGGNICGSIKKKKKEKKWWYRDMWLIRNWYSQYITRTWLRNLWLSRGRGDTWHSPTLTVIGGKDCVGGQSQTTRWWAHLHQEIARLVENRVAQGSRCVQQGDWAHRAPMAALHCSREESREERKRNSRTKSKKNGPDKQQTIGVTVLTQHHDHREWPSTQSVNSV